MTREELIAALHAPRLPAGTAALDLGALLVALGLGLLLGLALFALARPVLRPRAAATRPDALLAGLAALDPPARALATARLFGTLGAPVPDAVAARLYRPGAVLDPNAIGPALAAAWESADPAARRAARV